MVDISAQFEELENFSKLLTCIFARGTTTYRYSSKKALLEEGCLKAPFLHDSENQIIHEAKLRLLATGFNVPDSWLSLDTSDRIEFGRETINKKPSYFVRIFSPSSQPIQQVLDEIHVALMRLYAEPEVSERTENKILPEKRTKPMSYRTAASHLGKAVGKKGKKHGAEWLKKCIDDGTIKCENLSRQTHIFSIDDFPASALPLIQPDQK